jgi:hypothetical protein
MNKSEHENAFDNGFRRCWDAGNLVFEWIKKIMVFKLTNK